MGENHLEVPIDENDHIRGDINAPVKFLEYGDFECEFCVEAYPVIKKIEKDLNGKLCFSFRNFPLSSIHPYAQSSAEAVECANAQGKFWEMHDKLLGNQQALKNKDLKKYAKELNLNMEKFNHDFDSHVFSKKVKDDIRSGEKSGVEEIPAFFINDVLYMGPYDYDSLMKIINEELKKFQNSSP